MNKIAIELVDGADDSFIPKYATSGSSGADLRYHGEVKTLQPGERYLAKTGIKIQIPLGLEGQVRSRSGLAIKYGIAVLNSPGTIDSDYRGEIGVILINHSSEYFVISSGDRIAQIVFSLVSNKEFVKAEELETTIREGGGFGHTGI